MLSFFRRLVESTVGKVIVFVILGVIAMAFLLSDLNGFNGPGDGADATIAKVDGHKIGATELARAVDREIDAARQQMPGSDPATFAAGGGVERTLDGLIAARALDAFAADQGLVASKRLVDGAIASIPAFNGPAGTFDQATFNAVIAQQRLSEQQVRRELASDVLRRQLLIPAAGGARAPTGVVGPYASLLLERRDGMIGFVPSAAMPMGRAPSDAEVQAYYRTNIQRFTIGERRVIRYALFGPETATVTPPGDADIAAYYKANAATYAGIAKRRLSQVVFPDQAAANAFAAKLRAGTAFAAAAQAAGFGPADTALGEQSEKQFGDLATPAGAAAVFALSEGGVSAPIRSELGWHVVRVDAIVPAGGKSIEAARPEIVEALTKQRRDAAITEQVSGIEDAIAGGASFADLVKQRKLTVVTTPPVLANGASPDTPGWRVTPELQQILKPAFQAGAGDDPTVETIGEAGLHALVAVDRIVPATPVPLAEVRGVVVSAIQREAAMKAARAIADGIVAKASKGVALSAAFAQAGVKLPAPEPSGARRIDISRPDAKAPPALASMFALAPGRARTVPAPGGQGWFVVKLDKITKGDTKAAPGIIDATQRQFAPVFASEYAEQFARSAQGTLKITRDADALAATKARIAGGTAGQ